ncbi:hypothetical protein RFI_02342 [Reticulomyxa filosa]|uniref:TRAF-type domain-containing protein n=1 Tax=Reticulomyxa filosa TaxID=46433 RepID=X6P9F5_RETFI|nr:hypothetical protein RFI_02342 [Reticulomyxa filosa]|eukprot:ETO34748.1 hypothetical protein RFI_02342 [Reticulomyxa filosa]
MNKTEDEKSAKQLENRATLFSREHCFNKDWILQSNKQEQINYFICLYCKHVANSPIELNCIQHKQLTCPFIIGENCLNQFLKDNPNSCPVQSHNDCKYSQSKLAQVQIDDLQDLQAPTQEGEGNEKLIKELNDHLDNSCILKLLNCWYKSFGCDHTCSKQKLQEHLVSNLKVHFDLAVKFVESLKQTIQLHQDEIIQLKLQVESYKKKNEENLVLANENTELKKEIESKQKELLAKTHEMEKQKRESQQELLKLCADIGVMQKEFAEKEKQYHEKLIKLLEEKNEKLTPHTQQMPSKDEQKEDNKMLSLDTKHSPACTFDWCHSFKLLNTCYEHSKTVYNIQYSSIDGNRFLCSAADDGKVCVWNLDTNKQKQIFDGHSGCVYSAKFSPYHSNQNRPTICSASYDKTIRFWDIETAQQFQICEGHTSYVYGIQFSSFTGGKYLCSASHDDSIRLWDVETAKALHIFKGHSHNVWCVEFSPLQSNNKYSNSYGVIGGTGYTICSGSFDKTVRLWDIENKRQLVVFNEHQGFVRSVKYSRNETGIVDSNMICSASDDKTIRLWDIRTQKQSNSLKGHTDAVRAVDYVPFEDGNIICSGSTDNTIRFWDIRTNKQLHCITGNAEINSFEFIKFDQKTKNSTRNGCGYALCYGSGNGRIHFLE